MRSELDSKALKQLSDKLKSSNDYRTRNSLPVRLVVDYIKKKQLKQRHELVRRQVLQRKALIRHQQKEMGVSRLKWVLTHSPSREQLASSILEREQQRLISESRRRVENFNRSASQTVSVVCSELQLDLWHPDC